MFLFLSRCEQDYPFGVPARYIEEASIEQATEPRSPQDLVPEGSAQIPCDVRFQTGNVLRAQIGIVASDVTADTDLFSQELNTLLGGIIERGLKLERDEVYVANVDRCFSQDGTLQNATDSQVVRGVGRELSQAEVSVVLLCGEQAASHFFTQETSERGWRESGIQGMRFLVTHSLADVLRTRQKKKEFWQDLQLAMNEAGMTVT